VVFADLVGEQVRRGASVLSTITNDAWYGYSWAPKQHFAQVVLRAAENRRWMARAALTGISGFVDPRPDGCPARGRRDGVSSPQPVPAGARRRAPDSATAGGGGGGCGAGARARGAEATSPIRVLMVG
jgi:hypothetical protein